MEHACLMRSCAFCLKAFIINQWKRQRSIFSSIEKYGVLNMIDFI